MYWGLDRVTKSIERIKTGLYLMILLPKLFIVLLIEKIEDITRYAYLKYDEKSEFNFKIGEFKSV